MTRGRFLPIAILIAALSALPSSRVGASEGDVSGLRLLATREIGAANDIAAGRGRLYVSEANMTSEAGAGVAVVDTNKDPLRIRSFIPCNGFENDIVTRGDLLVVGYHYSQCAGTERNSGLRIIDAAKPERPLYLGSVAWKGGAHTITRYPGSPYVYASPGGSTPLTSAYYSREVINSERIVDISDPRNPKVVATFTTTPAGCHDVAFDIRKGRKLAFCIGEGGTQVWDVEDPLSPEVIGIAPLPQGVVPHYAAVSPDGRLLVVASEDHVHECAGGNQGGLHVYDLADPRAPRLLSVFKPQRAEFMVGTFQTASPCLAHNFEFIPGTRKVVSSWFTSGTSVVDLEDPTTPDEVAFFDAPDSWALAAYWYRGLVYVADQNRGLDILKPTFT